MKNMLNFGLRTERPKEVNAHFSSAVHKPPNYAYSINKIPLPNLVHKLIRTVKIYPHLNIKASDMVFQLLINSIEYIPLNLQK